MIKKLLRLFLCSCLLLPLLGCGGNTSTSTPTTPHPTEAPEEASVLKILIIGNSHSEDAFALLSEAFRDQLPDQNILTASLYYSGCSITQHNDFAVNGETVYRYTINENGTKNIIENVSLSMGLKAQKWDIIMLQAAKSDLDNTLNLNGRRKLEQYIEEYAKKPYALAWHTSWPSPNDETFFSSTWNPQPPAGYQANLMQLYGFNPVTQLGVLTEKGKTHIVPDETYAYKICTGAGIMHAHMVQGAPQLEIWRDYTHLNDFGRLIAAYSMYTQITGNEITQIGLDTVPAAKRYSRYQSQGDLNVTDEMKQVIIQAANYSLAEPWTVPVQN